MYMWISAFIDIAISSMIEASPWRRVVPCKKISSLFCETKKGNVGSICLRRTILIVQRYIKILSSPSTRSESNQREREGDRGSVPRADYYCSFLLICPLADSL